MNKDEAKNLLPWYAVGALEDDEAQAVEVFLNISPELQQELAQLRVLGDAVAEVGEDEPVFRSELINDALARIETVEQVKPTRTPIVEASMKAQEGGFIAWLRDTLVGGWQESPGGARLAMVVQFGFILALGVVLLTPTGTDVPPGPADGGVLVGADGAPGQGPEITLSFNPDVTVGAMVDVINDIGGQIVAGPSTQGIYTVRLPDADEQQLNETVAKLREDTAAIRFVRKKRDN